MDLPWWVISIRVVAAAGEFAPNQLVIVIEGDSVMPFWRMLSYRLTAVFLTKPRLVARVINFLASSCSSTDKMDWTCSSGLRLIKLTMAVPWLDGWPRGFRSFQLVDPALVGENQQGVVSLDGHQNLTTSSAFILTPIEPLPPRAWPRKG